jgi:hypothetical protein
MSGPGERVGIVGHEAAKFTRAAEGEARAVIRRLLADSTAILVSGACHLGGIDIWAEAEADAAGMRKEIYPPKTYQWATGYKPRNILIAEYSDVVHCIVVAEYPEMYNGMRFKSCYHCGTTEHVKSGGCWTAKYAERLGKPAYWHTIGTRMASVGALRHEP